MSLVIYLAIVGMLAILNFGTALNQRNDPILAWVIVFVIWIMYAGNNDNPDYAAYFVRYELAQHGKAHVGAADFEPGFQLLTAASVGLGLSYQAFVGVIATISLALIHRTILRIPGAANYVYPLYIVYPFLYDAIQLRNSLALAALIYGLGVLVEGKRRHRIIFAGWLAVSVSFHFTAIFYAVILLIPWIRDRRLGAWPIALGAGGTFITLLSPGSTEILANALESISGDGRYQSYLETRAQWAIVIPLVFQIWGLILLGIAHKATGAVSSDGDNAEAAYAHRWATLAVNVCILSVVVFPLYVYGSNFWRIPRNLHIVYYLAFFLGQRALVGRRPQRILFNLGVVTYSFGLLVFYSNLELVGVIVKNNAIFASLL